MRILVSGINYAPEPTGIGKYSGEMASWLAARGHDVVVVTAPPHYPEWRVRKGYEGSSYRREQLAGVDVRRTPVILPGGGRVSTRTRLLLESSFSLFGARWWIPQAMTRRPPDVVIAICPPLQASVWPRFLHATRRTPWVLHVQDLQVDAAHRLGLIGNQRVARALSLIERNTLRSASQVSTISTTMLKRVRTKGVEPSRSFLFPNWADLTTVTPRPPDAAMRRRMGASAEQTLVLYSGNLGHKQGLALVLHVAGLLRPRTDIRFAIVGDGAARAQLEDQARRSALDNVVFRDLVPVEDLSALLSAGDMHLVVQKREAADLVMPSKLTNILAAGRACIATADPGTELHTIIDQHHVGRVTPPDDVTALAQAIVDLADDDEKRSVYGVNARRYAQSNLDRDAILSRFEARLIAIAKGAHRA